MRELILNRIQAIGKVTSNFSATTMRWKNFTFMEKKLHDIVFEELSDTELLSLFERIVRRANQLM